MLPLLRMGRFGERIALSWSLSRATNNFLSRKRDAPKAHYTCHIHHKHGCYRMLRGASLRDPYPLPSWHYLHQRYCRGLGFIKAQLCEAAAMVKAKKKKGKSKDQCASDLEEEEEDFTDPSRVFSLLRASKTSGNMPSSDRSKLSKLFGSFADSDWVRTQALAFYLRPSFFNSASARFRRFFMRRCFPSLRKHLLELSVHDSKGFLFRIFADFCSHEFPEELMKYQALLSTADLTKPHTWYPFARAIRRKVIYHCGPTNSGKTHNALQRFIEASSGIYCSPLRLLAMEVFEKVNADGVYCSLVTGQERKEVLFSQHLACTIEMASTEKTWEVAIIDEVQMISDEFRGWAWTRALLGLQVDEMHVCGDPSALALVRNLCALTGDTIEEMSYERFKPLTVDIKSLEGDVKNVEPGDCVVAFSRKEIFSLKKAIEKATENRCCVIYGSLPPETRTEQARLFNDPKSGFDVLVASDAVGMGLNLNIRRIVFYSIDKFNGERKTYIPSSQVKQIAGRAGRRGSHYPEGVATTFFGADVNYIRESLKAPYEEVLSAGLFPALEQMEVFASQMSNVTFSHLLDRFSETCQLDGSYFLCRNDHIKRVACVMDGLKDLTFEERFQFCFTPVNTREPLCMSAFVQFAMAYSKKEKVLLPVNVPSRFAKNDVELHDLEICHQIASMYLWLSQHFLEDLFPDAQQATEVTSVIAVLLGQSLAQTLSTTFSISSSKTRGSRWRKKITHKPTKQESLSPTLVKDFVLALRANLYD